MSLSRRTSRLSCLPILALLLASASVFAGTTEDARARNAVRVISDIQAIPEAAIPDKLFDEAHAIVVIPDSIKAGFVFGARRGHGLLSIKRADGTWSNPGFVTLTGGSIGFQAGVQSADIVLVFRSERGLDSIVNGKFTLGADAGVAAGPVGRNASAATDGQLKAEIWSWSRARGLFAGVAIDGAVLSMDDAGNEAVYGRDTTPRMIFEGRNAQRPSSAVVGFRDALEEATAAARVARSTDNAASRPAAAVSPAPAPMPASTQPASSSPAAQSGGFQPVEDNPATTEPLPTTP
ncbi:MAG: lipid-binding SYLF domain-containing protein [Luteimonas sp.]